MNPRLLIIGVLLSSATNWSCSRPEAGGPATSTAAMIERLALIQLDIPASANFFDNQRALEELRTTLLAVVDEMSAGDIDQLAWAHLAAGESERAEELWRGLIERIEAAPEQFNPSFELLVRERHVTALLRLAEQNNCLAGHHQASCLFPVTAATRHEQPEFARRAAESLAALLGQPRLQPDDDQRLLWRWLLGLARELAGEGTEASPETRAWGQALSRVELPPFRNVAPHTGAATVGLSGGSVTEDLDGDGLPDLMASSWGAADPLRVLSGSCDDDQLTYADTSSRAGVAALPGGLNLLHADVDNDGDVDVLVLRGAWLQAPTGNLPNSLLLNDGTGRFEDVTEEVGLLDFFPTQTAAWGDVDNDGRLDLFVGNEVIPGRPGRSRLYVQQPTDDGSLRFEDRAAEWGAEVTGFVKGAAWGDIDDDGWPDLYVSRYQQSNLLLHNVELDGRRRFVDVTESAGVAEPIDSFATGWFDHDQDGLLDLFVAAFGRDFRRAGAAPVLRGMLEQSDGSGTPRLFRNRGDGTFEDMTERVGLRRPMLAMGANIGDIDNDGWPDLYFGTGAPSFTALVPNRLFVRRGEGYLDATGPSRLGHLQKGHGVSFADLDTDGDLDLFHVVGGAYSGDVYPDALWANPGTDSNWLALELQGTEANRSAIGARVMARTNDGRTLHRAVSTGMSFGSSSLRVHLGLGSASGFEQITIRWPGSNTLDELRGLPVNQTLRITEGGTWSPIDPVPCSLDG